MLVRVCSRPLCSHLLLLKILTESRNRQLLFFRWLILLFFFFLPGEARLCLNVQCFLHTFEWLFFCWFYITLQNTMWFTALFLTSFQPPSPRGDDCNIFGKRFSQSVSQQQLFSINELALNRTKPKLFPALSPTMAWLLMIQCKYKRAWGNGGEIKTIFHLTVKFSALNLIPNGSK